MGHMMCGFLAAQSVMFTPEITGLATYIVNLGLG